MRRQLTQDQLPMRKSQLYNTYGPGGSTPLIPTAQSGSPPLSIKTVDTSDGSGQYVQIFNGNPVAVDVSGYKLQGSTSITLRQGELDCGLCTRTAQAFFWCAEDRDYGLVTLQAVRRMTATKHSARQCLSNVCLITAKALQCFLPVVSVRA